MPDITSNILAGILPRLIAQNTLSQAPPSQVPQQQPQGLLTPGNIDLNTIESDGKTILLPTAIDGRIVSELDDAVAHYKKTGQHMGIFRSLADADQYDKDLHNRMGWNGPPGSGQDIWQHGAQTQQAPQVASQGPSQLDPLAQHILQQSIQTPQDLYEKYRRLYFGLDPNDKNAQPTTKQRIKKGALEFLQAMFTPADQYKSMPDRLRERAQKDYALQTPRLGIAAPLENLQARIAQLQNVNKLNEEKLAETKRYNAEKGQNAETRNFINLFGVQGRNDNAATRNRSYQQQVDQNAPLTAAKTRLLGTQNQNLVDNRGLVGPYAAMAQMLHMTPEQSAEFLKNGKGIRDNTRFAPQAGGAGGTNRLNFMQSTQYDPDADQMLTQNQITAINPKTLEVTPVGNIKQPVGSLSTKEVEKVNDFSSAATMARQLTNTIAQSINSGKAPDFMGLLAGNGISAGARATGAFGQSKSFNESLFQILKGNGLFQHVSSFAGKRITNRELDYMNKYLGKQTDTPVSALAASIAAAQLLEVAKLQKAHVLSEDYNPTPIMQAEHDRFMRELGYGMDDKSGDYIKIGPGKANPTLRSMREILIQNGVLRKSGGSTSDTPAAPTIDKGLLDRINKKLAEKKGQ